MKRLLILLLIFSLFPFAPIFAKEHNINAKNPTYDYILMKKGYDFSKITAYYIKRADFCEILSLMLGKEISAPQLPEYGYIYGRDFVNVLKEQNISTEWARVDSPFLNRVLTFPEFFELLDYIFSDIIEAAGFTYESGFMTGKINQLDLYLPGRAPLKVTGYQGFIWEPVANPVWVVLDQNTLVELIIETPITASYGEMSHKKEIKGTFYYYENQEHYLILDLGDRELKKFKTLANLHILGHRDYRENRNQQLGDKKIYCYTGNYKKQLNLIAIAVERIDYQ